MTDAEEPTASHREPMSNQRLAAIVGGIVATLGALGLGGSWVYDFAGVVEDVSSNAAAVEELEADLAAGLDSWAGLPERMARMEERQLAMDEQLDRIEKAVSR